MVLRAPEPDRRQQQQAGKLPARLTDLIEGGSSGEDVAQRHVVNPRRQLVDAAVSSEGLTKPGPG